MNFQVQLDNKINKQSWTDFIKNHPNGNIFQTPEMHDFFSGVKNYQPLAIACLNEREELKGILLSVVEKEHRGIMGKFSSRTIAWGGPLVSDSKDEHIIDLILNAWVARLGKKTIYLELRNLFPFTGKMGAFQKNGFIYREHLNFQVNTTAGQDPLKQLSSSRRRQIKKSLASGARIEEAARVEQIDEFYQILYDLYKNRIRKPLPDRSFFENFFFAGKKLGKYFVVTFRNKVIGGIMCPIYRNRVIYEWYVCGLDTQYPNQYPSVLATWAAINYAHEHRIGYFDFMGAGAPDQDYGVREFKARFGGMLVNSGRFIRINNRVLYNSGKLGLKILGVIKKI